MGINENMLHVFLIEFRSLISSEVSHIYNISCLQIKGLTISIFIQEIFGHLYEFRATNVNACTHATGGEIHVLLFFRVEFGIFLSYKFRAFKILLVKFPNLVIFFFTGQNP